MAAAIQDAGLGPVLAAFAYQQPALNANGRTGMNRAVIVDLKAGGHGGISGGADGFTHGLVQHGGDDAAMDVGGWPLEFGRDRGQTYHAASGSRLKMKAKPIGIRGAASETVVLWKAGDGGRLFCAFAHSSRL